MRVSLLVVPLLPQGHVAATAGTFRSLPLLPTLPLLLLTNDYEKRTAG